MRAGREPAEDVKKRMVAACKQAGLTVQSAWMRLQKEYGYRLIRVDAITPGGRCRKSVIGLSAVVGIDGSVSDVNIGCAAGIDGCDDHRMDIPIMYGREAVPLDDLVDHLKRTAEEREQVAASRMNGVSGPYVFGDVRSE